MPQTTTFMPLNVVVIRGKQEELPVYLSDYQFSPLLCLRYVGPNENEVLEGGHCCIQLPVEAAEHLIKVMEVRMEDVRNRGNVHMSR